MAVHPRLFPGGWLRFGREKELAEKYKGELAVKAPSVSTAWGICPEVISRKWRWRGG